MKLQSGRFRIFPNNADWSKMWHIHQIEVVLTRNFYMDFPCLQTACRICEAIGICRARGCDGPEFRAPFEAIAANILFRKAGSHPQNTILPANIWRLLDDYSNDVKNHKFDRRLTSHYTDLYYGCDIEYRAGDGIIGTIDMHRCRAGTDEEIARWITKLPDINLFPCDLGYFRPDSKSIVELALNSLELKFGPLKPKKINYRFLDDPFEPTWKI